MMIRKLMRGNRTLFVQNIDELKRFAEIISRFLAAGDRVALNGSLGAGKTTFTQFLCRALGIPGKITSPTFTLLNDYTVDSLTVAHGDLYRLTEAEIEDSLPELEAQLMTPNTLALMEWADRAPELEHVWTWVLTFNHDPEYEAARRITIACDDEARLMKLMQEVVL